MKNNTILNNNNNIIKVLIRRIYIYKKINTKLKLFKPKKTIKIKIIKVFKIQMYYKNNTL